MRMLGWIIFLIVPVLLLLASESFVVDGRSDRYMKWTKDDTNNRYNLQLCDSKSEGEVWQCRNFAWRYQSCMSGISSDHSSVSKCQCSEERIDSSRGNFMQCYA